MEKQPSNTIRIELKSDTEFPTILIDAGMVPGGAILQLISRSGAMVEMVVEEKGGARLAIWDSTNKPRVMMGIDDNNHTGLLLEDEHGRRVLSVTSDPNRPVITAYKNNTPVFKSD